MLDRYLSLSSAGYWLGFLCLLIAACGDSQQEHPYDETLDPYEQLAIATADAEKTDRSLLLIFGANWCPDCRKLDRAMNQGPVKDIVDRHFVVLKVDIGNWDRNLNFISLWESPVASGIPAAVLSTTQYDILYATKAGELANARNMGAEELTRIFRLMASSVQQPPEPVAKIESQMGDT